MKIFRKISANSEAPDASIAAAETKSTFGARARAAAPFYATMLAPLLAISALSFVLIVQDLHKIDQGEVLAEKLTSIEAAFDVAAAMKRERGMSYGFLTSGGDAFGAALARQRSELDALIAAHRERLTTGVAATLAGPAAAERAASLAAMFDALPDRRAAIDRLEANAAETFEVYSAAVDALISFSLDPIAAGSANGLAGRFAALQSVKIAAEHAGAGRAFGAAVFGADPAAPEALTRVEAALGHWRRHDAAVKHAKRVVTAKENSLLVGAVDGEAAQTVAARRAVIAASAESGDLGGVDAEQWFAEATAYVNELGAAADAMTSDIRVEIDAQISAARLELWEILGGGAFMFALVIGVGVRHASSLIGAMRALRASIERIERQEADIVVPAQNRSDELGGIARSLATISEQGAQSARVSAALAGAASAVVIVDVRGAVVFANQSFNKLRDARATAFATFVSADNPDCFGQLLELLEKLEASGRIIQKSHGETAIEVNAGGAIFEARRTPTTNRNGDVIGYAIDLNDVTGVRGLEMEVTNVIEGVQRGELMHSVDSIDDRGFTSFIARGLNEQMESINSFMSALDTCLAAIASGDLTAEMDEVFDGDFEGARTAVNENLLRFREMFAAIRVAADRVRATADPIAADARDLAERSEGQAAALEQTSATMDSMSKTISANADNAGRARELAETATGRVESGRAVLADTTDAMSRIEESSARIAEIVNVIDSIAFQTNLLALNAAVEAARAGEAGKGFAVVASEVRTLAQRSADAAKDIRGLIAQSGENVDQGAALVQRTTDSLGQIGDAIETLSGVVAEMTAASLDQATGAREINSTISHLDGITQRNAAAAQHSAEAAERLRAEAENLQEKVSFFNTGDVDPAATEAA